MYDNIITQSKWCDVNLNDNEWRLASIIKIEGDIITVSFDGWSSNKNKSICLHSPCIAPARMHSRGYTGQKSYPLRNWELDLNTMQSVENKMNLYPKVAFNNVTGLEMMQLFRCELFVLVDKIFFHDWKTENHINLSRVSEFFSSIIQIVINIFGKFSILLSQANNSKYSEDSYLNNTYVCYIECTYELILIMHSILGFDNRTKHFYENHESEITSSKFVDLFIESGGINFLLKFFKNYENSVIFERKFYILINICNLFLSVLTTNNSSKKINKTQRIVFVSELINFMKKENFINKLKEKEDKDYLPFIHLLESLIKKLPDLEKSKKYLTFIQDLSGSGSNTDMTKYLNDFSQNETGIFKKIGDMESKIKLLETKLDQKNKVNDALINNQQNVLGEIRLNLDSNNTYANDEYSILSGIEFLISNNNAIQSLKLIKWRKKIIEIANNNGWIVAKIIAANTMKKFEINENDIIEANLTFMEQFSHVQQSVRNSDSSANLINLYEKELLLSINSLIEDNLKK